MPPLSEIFPGLIVPMAVAAVLLLIGWQPWRRGAERGNWAAAPAIAGGFAAGLPLILGAMPPFPPRDSTHWLMWYMPVVIVFGIIDGLRRPRARLRGPIGSIISAGLFALLLWPLIRSDSSRSEALLSALVFTGLTMLWWLLIEPLSRCAPGGSMPLIFLMTSTAIALVISFSNSQKYGQFAGALCAAIGVAMALGWRNGRVTLARGGVFAISLVSFALLATGNHFADVSLRNVLLIAIAPLLAWIAEAPGVARITGWKKLALRVVLVSIPLAIAIIPTAIRFKREMETMYVY